MAGAWSCSGPHLPRLRGGRSRSAHDFGPAVLGEHRRLVVPFGHVIDLRLLTPLILLIALPLAGCGNPCVAVCEDSKACPEANVSANCDQLCESDKERAQGLDCLSQYEDSIDCQASFDDVCAPDDSCDESIATLATCLDEACAGNPDSELCNL